MKNKVKTCLPALAGLAIIACASLSAYATKPAHYIGSLTSYGGQGIILPIKGQANLTYEAKVAWSARNNTDGLTVLGCADQSDSANVISYVPFCFANTRMWCYMYGTGGYRTGGSSEPYADVCNLRAVMKDGDQKFIWGGTTNKTTTLASAGDIDVPLGLFARYCKRANGTFGFSNGVCAHLYWVKIYDADDNLIFNGKPCLDKDGVAGIYDTVSDEIYYNSGSGSLGAGTIIDEGVSYSLYITPSGAGKQDGTGWANAASTGKLTAMLEGCRSHRWGGVIRFKKGVYSPNGVSNYRNNSVPFVLGPNAKMIGGYAGESDDEEPDPAVNKTIISGSDGTLQWSLNGYSQGVGTLIVDNTAGTLNLPPAGDYPSTTAWFPSAAGRGFCFSSASSTNLVVANISFACSAGCALSLTSSAADGSVISNCVFAGGSPWTRTATCFLGNSEILMTDCAFYGCGTALCLNGSARAPQITVRRCTFQNNHHSGSSYADYIAAAVQIGEKPKVTLEDCVFNGNVCKRSDGPDCGAALAITTGSSAPILVRDCVFTNNYATGKGVGTVYLFTNARGTLTFDGCRFSKNFGRPSLYEYSTGGFKGVWNSLFEGNSNDIGSAVFAAYDAHSKSAEFVNCEFRNNYSKGNRTMSMGWTERPTNLSLIHCLFRDNDAFNSSGARISEIDWTRTAYTGNASAAFVNTIFTNSTAKDYVAVSPHVDEIFANCFLQGTNLTALTWNGNQGWRANDLTGIVGAPGLANDLITTRHGLSFSHLANKSPLRWKARKVYLASDGYCYLYHPNNADNKRWQSLHTEYAPALKYLTSAEGAALGLDPNNKPIQDARRRDRPRKISPGPVDYGVPGTFMTVR